MCSNVPGHMAMPSYGKKLKKNLLLQNKEADDFELGIQHQVLEYYHFVFQMMTLG